MSFLVRTRGLCRMCGERYEGLDSIDIYEPRGDKPAYYLLLRELLNLNPFRGDRKPDRLGITCARLLDEWARFRDQCAEAQKILAQKRAALFKDQQKEASNGASSSGCSNTAASGDETASCSTSGSDTSSSQASQLKRPLSSDSEDSEEDSYLPPKTRARKS